MLSHSPMSELLVLTQSRPLRIYANSCKIALASANAKSTPTRQAVSTQKRHSAGEQAREVQLQCLVERPSRRSVPVQSCKLLYGMRPSCRTRRVSAGPRPGISRKHNIYRAPQEMEWIGDVSVTVDRRDGDGIGNMALLTPQ